MVMDGVAGHMGLKQYARSFLAIREHGGREARGRGGADSANATGTPHADGADPCAANSLTICSRITYFCGLPVAVIGNSGTKRTWRGTLWCEIWPRQKD